MSTELEKYLKKNRKSLDVEIPDDTSIWKGIQKGRKEGTSGNGKSHGRVILLRLRNLAAVIVIALLAGYMINDIIGNIGSGREITLASVDRELAQKERDYRELIKYKKEEIGSFDKIDNLIINELIEELNNLDTIYNTVMNDLRENGYNEKIVNTIFDTYEKKVRILELIILETNKPENDENRKNTYL